MTNILITGYSGNVGSALANYLTSINTDYSVGVRNPDKYSGQDSTISTRKLDLEDPTTYTKALEGIKSVFLVRPPQLTDVDRIFKPFIKACEIAGVEHIVFLSLLGIEHNPFPPHYKIEKLLEASPIDYTFVRPSFFMQNLIEPHGEDIRTKNEIFIPSGKAAISFIDTDDIGEIVGKALISKEYRNKKYTITGSEAIAYDQVANTFTQLLGRKITYTNPGLLKFRKSIIQQGTKKEFANVMTVLYLTTKLGMAKKVTSTAELILGRKPASIRDFILKHKAIWE